MQRAPGGPPARVASVAAAAREARRRAAQVRQAQLADGVDALLGHAGHDGEAEADGASQVGGSEEESDAVACESDREGRASSHSGSGGADASPAVEVEPKSEPEPEPEPDPGPPPPERIVLPEFQQRTVAELYELGTSLNLRVGGISSKHDLIFEILSYWGKRGTKIDAEGVLEVTSDGYGFLRWPAFNFTPHADDV